VKKPGRPLLALRRAINANCTLNILYFEEEVKGFSKILIFIGGFIQAGFVDWSDTFFRFVTRQGLRFQCASYR
jgi:hypothetical protein